MNYSDQQRLEKIHEYATKLCRHIADNHIDKDMVMREETIRWMVTTPLYNIGEHVYFLSNDFKQAHKDVQWSMISGMRHRLIHDYDGTNWSIIADVLYDELPTFIRQIEDIMGG